MNPVTSQSSKPGTSAGMSTSERNEEIRRRRALPRGERPTLAELSREFGLSLPRVSIIANGGRVTPENNSADLTVRVAPDSVVQLCREGEGRYNALYVRGIGPHGRRIGLILGGNAKWVAETPSGAPTLRASSLREACKKLAIWAEQRGLV